MNGVIDFFYPPPPPRWTYEALDGGLERAQRVAGSYRMNRRSFTKLEGVTAALCLLAVSALTLRMLWNLDALSLEDWSSPATGSQAGAKEDDR